MKLEYINNLIINYTPTSSLKDYKPVINDHSENVLLLASIGYTKLAADHLLFPEINETLIETIADIIRKFNINFERNKLSKSHQSPITNHQLYDTLLEIVLNLYGHESRWLDKNKKDRCIEYIYQTLNEWEEKEKNELGFPAVAQATVQKILNSMKLVQKGISMVGKTAERIEEKIKDKFPITTNFLDIALYEIKGSIYYKMVEDAYCKFGNDYALGLRWLRHSGFEQVSTNPPLAAIAYQDDKSLIEIFKRNIPLSQNYSRWKKDSQKYADEITMNATLNALWDNLYVYRPIFFLLQETTGGGVVSFQLNPTIAHLVKESVEDVFSAFQQAEEKLKIYDDFLLAGYKVKEGRGRPNMVIKVSASHLAARDIARTINSYGFGSNITVIFTVAQEVTMILEEMAGMAGALKKGIKPTQLYMTNMGGRLESHLREVKLENLFAKLKEKAGETKATEKVSKLAEVNKTKSKVDECSTYDEKVIAATRYLHGQREIDSNIIESLSDLISKEELSSWEAVLQKAGTLVARRVWNIFFSPKNHEKWIKYICKNFDIDYDSARFIMDRINYLPASKRRPADTLLTLSSHNIVHTEFPNHQENVRLASEEKGFNITNFCESINDDLPKEVVEKLNEIQDFKKAYELNDELLIILKEVGIEDNFGNNGLKPSEWQDFGSVKKTLTEFSNAYNKFKEYILKEFSSI